MKRILLLFLAALLLVGCTPPAGTEGEPPAPSDTSISFCGDFAVCGAYAEPFKTALEAAGIPYSDENAKKIYVGEHENAPTAA